MSVDTILREAKAIVARDHTATQLAADAHGNRVRNPLAPTAVAWSITGALVKVAPRDPSIVAEHKSPGITDEGNRAYLLLEEAALEQGYLTVNEVDDAGHGAVEKLFLRAMQLVPEMPRRKPTAGTGSQPRGARAA